MPALVRSEDHPACRRVIGRGAVGASPSARELSARIAGAARLRGARFADRRPPRYSDTQVVPAGLLTTRVQSTDAGRARSDAEH